MGDGDDDEDESNILVRNVYKIVGNLTNALMFTAMYLSFYQPLGPLVLYKTIGNLKSDLTNNDVI